MKANPMRSESNDREALARLLPGFAERELPGGRHQQLQEFVMSEIHQDLRATAPGPRRSPVRRRVFLTSALTAAAAATAVAVVVGVGGAGSTEKRSDPPAPVALSGQQILLAAASTAERQPAATGTYWYVKTVSTDAAQATLEWETWENREGEHWARSGKTAGKVVKAPDRVRYTLGAPDVSFKELQALPTAPDALKAWITDAALTRNPHKDPERHDERVFFGLISLVSQLPVSAQVRAAAFQAIAAYPNVKSLGPVEGGVALEISLKSREPLRLVIDPATSKIRETTFFVMSGGALYFQGKGGSVSITTEWTEALPA